MNPRNHFYKASFTEGTRLGTASGAALNVDSSRCPNCNAFRDEPVPEELIVEVSESRKFGFYAEVLRSLEPVFRKDLVDLWLSAGLTGFRPVPVRMVRNEQFEPLRVDAPTYIHIAIQSRVQLTVPPIISKCPVCGFVKYDFDARTGIQVDEITWDGSDFFRPAFYPAFVLCSQRAARLTLESGYNRALSFIRVEEYDTWDDSGAISDKAYRKLLAPYLIRDPRRLDINPVTKEEHAIVETVADLVGRGAELRCQGKFEEAISCYDEAIQTDPREAPAWNNKGIALVDLGQYQEALACYDEAMNLAPEDPSPRYNKAHALHKLGRFEESLRYVEQAKQMNPRDPDVWVVEGNVLCELGRFVEAIDRYDTAITLGPSVTLAWLNKAKALERSGYYHDALASYDRVLEADPLNVEAWRGKGTVLGQLGRFNEALGCYDHVLMFYPQNPEIWFAKAYDLANGGRLEEAMHCLEKVLTLDPNHGSSLYVKALIEDELGQVQSAIQSFRRFLSKASNASKGEIENARQRLKDLVARK